MIEALERISCVMVTRPCPERFEFFKRSIACFLAQTYPARELVVVLDEGHAEAVERVRRYLAPIPGGAVVVQPQGKRTLGALRNLSIEASTGPMACQWDDDDLSHPTRLQEQYALLRREDALAVALAEALHLFPQSRQIFWENFCKIPNRCHPGTLMFRRGSPARYPETGPESGKGEDTAFLARLRAQGKVSMLAGMPHLYVYVYHGANTWDHAHHQQLATVLSISRGLLTRRRSVLDQVACLDLGEHPIDVMGHNGPAFQIAGCRTSPGLIRDQQ